MLIFRKSCYCHLRKVRSISFIYQNNTSEARKKEQIPLSYPPRLRQRGRGLAMRCYIGKGKFCSFKKAPPFAESAEGALLEQLRCVMGELKLDDLVDLGEFLQRQRHLELAKEGLSRILLKGIGDSGEQRRLRSDVLGNDSEELGWRASAGRPGANWKRRIRMMLRRRR
jgi:hypothetical protein